MKDEGGGGGRVVWFGLVWFGIERVKGGWNTHSLSHTRHNRTPSIPLPSEPRRTIRRVGQSSSHRRATKPIPRRSHKSSRSGQA